MGGFSVLFLFLFLTTLGKALEGGAARGPEGGYHYGYDPEKLYVHLVPHTHDDVGWLKTVDEYYYGGGHAHVATPRGTGATGGSYSTQLLTL